MTATSPPLPTATGTFEMPPVLTALRSIACCQAVGTAASHGVRSVGASAATLVGVAGVVESDSRVLEHEGAASVTTAVAAATTRPRTGIDVTLSDSRARFVNQQASAEGTCISSRVDRSRRGDAVAWDFSTDLSSRRSSTGSSSSARRRSSRSTTSSRTRSAHPTRWSRRYVREPPAGGQGPGPVGDLPRRGARRPRLRPAQARPAQRDHRPLRLGAADVRRRRARHREHGDARRLRHRGAEGALARAAAQPGDVLRPTR